MANVHTYSILATCFLLFFFFQLSTFSLAISNGVFNVDLIHRHHSPLSPYYNSSMTFRERLKKAPHKRSISHVKYAGISSDSGEYLIKFTLGTPKVEQFAIADTGSSLIWVQCSPCQFCIPQNFPFFNPSKSATFRTLTCASKACTNTQDFDPISCPLDQNNTKNNYYNSLPCQYRTAYGGGTQTIGILATETIGFPSMSLPLSVIGCGFFQNGTLVWSGDGEGIIGLGPGPASLISQLGKKVNYKFSYCFTPLLSGYSSKLTFGANLKGSKVVSTPFITNASSLNHLYVLTLDGISIKAKHKPMLVSTTGLVGIIDSGTTQTYLPQSVYDVVKVALVSAIGLSPVIDPDFDLCYKTRYHHNGPKFNPPDVVFHFSGADVVLKAYNIFFEVEDNLTCLIISNTTESFFIFGNIAQVNFHIEYDLQAQQISFAPTDCTKY